MTEKWMKVVTIIKEWRIDLKKKKKKKSSGVLKISNWQLCW